MVGAALLMLTACATSDEVGAPASKELRFGPESPGAVVIVGVRSLDDAEGLTILSSDTWQVVWTRFSENTFRFLRPYRDIVSRRSNCVMTRLLPLGCSDDHRDVQYSVHVTQPGFYALREVRHGSRHRTVFATDETSLIIDSDLRSALQSDKLPRFQVKAGEIAYIGDYVFDVGDSPVKLVAMERSDEALEQLRGQIPGLKGEIKYRGSKLLLEREPLEPRLEISSLGKQQAAD